MDNIAEKIFAAKSCDLQKLIPYGFKTEGDGYYLKRPICGGQMNLSVTVDRSGSLCPSVEDADTGEKYTLHLVEDSEGEFVGRVRAEYTAALEDISRKCFVSEIFKSSGFTFMSQYVREKYGSPLEFLWEDSYSAIYRRPDNAKWYALVMRVKRGRIAGCGGDPDEEIEISDVRVSPKKLQGMLDGVIFFPAYHMNKRNWITVRLDAGLASERLRELIDDSYAIALGKSSVKRRK